MVGLDDALIELKLQQQYLSQKQVNAPSNLALAKTKQSFGIDALITAQEQIWSKKKTLTKDDEILTQ